MVMLPTLRLSDSAGDPVSGPAARRAARTELRHAEYGQDKPGWTSRVLNWIGRHISALFDGSGGGSHALLILFVVLLAVVVVVAVRAGVPTRRGRAGGGADTDPLAPDGGHDHRRLAALLAAEGRRAEALREWLRAAVQTIENRGVLPPRPGRTGATTAREAGPLLPSAAAALAAGTGAFDEVWFGGRPATDTDVAAGQAAADAVATARITTGPAPAGMAVPR